MPNHAALSGDPESDARFVPVHDFEHRSLGEVVYQLTVVIVPVIALVFAALQLRNSPLAPVMLTSFLVMYSIAGLGVTIGFHRLLTHRSFETYPIVRYAFAIMGTMSAQGYFFNWIAEHRVHHMHSDHELDPHSPHRYGEGLWNQMRGLFHSHLGWLIKPRLAGIERYITDLKSDNVMVWIDKLSLLWVALGFVGPALVSYVFTRSVAAATVAALWGGPVRIFFLNHTTWSINSICHTWGKKPFASNDESRNNWLFGILAFGEGWHNNHHAFPRSAKHGLFRYQVDMSYLLIRLMELMGLAWKLNVPDESVIGRRLTRMRKV